MTVTGFATTTTARPAASVTAWCEDVFGSPVAAVLFRGGNLSLVLGVRLGDGQKIVLKARPAAPRQAGCVEVQRRLWSAGYPCPRPLAGPDEVGGQVLTAETWMPGGRLLARDASAPGRFATALARLVRLAPAASEVPPLDPPPPWAAWDHGGPGLWPVPLSGPADLNAVAGPQWLDDVAAQVRARLAVDRAVPVVGHVDFESQNLRWQGSRLHCVHDWDSAAIRSEAAMAGLAAATFPAVSRLPAAASPAEGERFLLAYAAARGRAWSTDEWQVAWAAGLWALAYNARVEGAEGGGQLTARLAGEVRHRLRMAAP